jgi:hypothetical protein
MKDPRFPKSTALSLALLGLLACTSDAGDESLGGLEPEYRTKPKGPDNGPGSLVVVAPPVVPGTKLATAMVELVTGRAALPDARSVGTAFTGLQAETVQMLFRYQDDKARGGAGADVQIKAKTASQVRLGGLAVKLGTTPTTVLEGYRFLPTLKMTDASPTYQSLDVSLDADGKTTYPVLPGEYIFAYGLLDGVVANVAPGASVALDAGDYAQRRVAKIVPGAKELPDVCPLSTGVAVLSYVDSEGHTHTLSQSLAAPFELGNNPRVIVATNAGQQPTLEIELPCVAGRAPIPLGMLGAGPLVMKLGRLDVDDVDVTMGDGSVKKVRGTYQVYDASGTREVVSMRLQTNTGIDLPPGQYKVVVTYPQGAGTTGTFSETFRTP